jgi:hypothetical protein
VYDPPMTFTILSGRWVGDNGCPAKSSTKGGHPKVELSGQLHSLASLPPGKDPPPPPHPVPIGYEVGSGRCGEEKHFF